MKMVWPHLLSLDQHLREKKAQTHLLFFQLLPNFFSYSLHEATATQVTFCTHKKDVRSGCSGEKTLFSAWTRFQEAHQSCRYRVTGGTVSHHWVLHCWWQAAVKEELASCLWSSHGGDSKLQTDKLAPILWSLTGATTEVLHSGTTSFIYFLFMYMCVLWCSLFL